MNINRRDLLKLGSASGLAAAVLASDIVKPLLAQNSTNAGVKEGEIKTGWHVIAPWNEVHKMDKTVGVYTCANSVNEGAKPDADAIWAPTKDGIKMGFDVSVFWLIKPAV